MNTQQTLENMKHMRLYGMYDAYQAAVNSNKTNDLTHDQLVAQLVQHELEDRSLRKLERLVKAAKFRYKAHLEEVIFSPDRGLDSQTIYRLSEGNYIPKAENILITGSTGAGKSYLACALGQQACLLGYSVLYFNTSRLMTLLKMDKATGHYLRKINRLQRTDVLILDDYGLQVLDKDARTIFMDLIEDRYQRKSCIIASQLPVNKWYDIIGESTHADAIMDRIMHHHHRITIEGESMRRKKTEEPSDVNPLNPNP